MTDLIIISLLLFIIGFLIATYHPEVAMWAMIIILVIIIVVVAAILIIQVANDPVGFLRSLICDNPLMTFTREMANVTVNMSQRVGGM